MFNLGFPAFDRRHFLKHLAGFSLMALPGFQFLQRLRAAAPQMKKDGKSLIVLWMGGGPPTIDLWDLKFGKATAFDDKPITTKVSGIQISPNLPKVAAQMQHLAIVRSLSTSEGDHNRGTTLMHTGRTPNPVVTNPSIGAMVAYRNRQRTQDLDVPSFISVGGSRVGPGFLGMNYAPFVLGNPGSPPENLKPPATVGQGAVGNDRVRRRQRLFYAVEDHFRDQLTPYLPRNAKTGEVNEAERKKVADAVIAHEEVYGKAFRLVASDSGKVFEFNGDDRKILGEYTGGAPNNAFGRGCLMARKLVEQGVTAVEVILDGWDLHNNTQAGVKRLGGMLDAGMGTLVKDLVQRGLWDKTVLLWMGEFGRTPRINANAGRDHWPNTWSVVLGGGGIKGGQVYGATNDTGMEIKDAKASVGDVFATVYQALGFDPKTDRDVRDNLGRPFPLTEGDSHPLKGLI